MYLCVYMCMYLVAGLNMQGTVQTPTALDCSVYKCIHAYNTNVYTERVFIQTCVLYMYARLYIKFTYMIISHITHNIMQYDSPCMISQPRTLRSQRRGQRARQRPKQMLLRKLLRNQEPEQSRLALGCVTIARSSEVPVVGAAHFRSSSN